MSPLGRKVLMWMIPVNLLMLVWVWIGRIAFGVGGWFFLIMLYALPFLFLALLATTLMGFLIGSDRPRALTRAQALAQLAMWAAMAAFGFFIVDFGDAPESDLSVFTQLVGRNDATLSLSWTLTAISGGIVIAAWVILLVLLLAQRRSHRAALAAA
ncbi:MAG: hypothetical protein ABIN79_10785 [Marmoricola sp.]